MVPALRDAVVAEKGKKYLEKVLPVAEFGGNPLKLSNDNNHQTGLYTQNK